MSSRATATKGETLHDRLLAWYDVHRRRLPWRAEPGMPIDPYAVLVSEVMLQQTTVATVTGRFAAFMARFPTLEALADAALEDVLHEWQGLGYYRRARGLHAAARALRDGHGGRWPRATEALRTLPGLGPYTAAAVAAIAFDEPVLAVDGNVERVLARLFAVTTPLPRARTELRRLAATLAPPHRAGDTVQAMIELGALVCRPRAPACLACPLAADCRARASGIAAELPRRQAKVERPARFAVAFRLARSDGSVLFRRRPPTGLLASMVELPGTPWGPARPSVEETLQAAPTAGSWSPVPGRVRHVFTHLALEVEVWTLDGADGACADGLWCRPERFASLALPTLTKKLLAHAAA
jgi:A/G-specific adenine glycosylase